TCWRRARTAGSAESRTRKTIVKSPSGRSPKRCWRTSLARSESVPGTLNELARSGPSREYASTPATRTSAHAPTTSQRFLMIKRVQLPMGPGYDLFMSPRRDIDRLRGELEDLFQQSW